jgi:hypothetical protein
MSNLGLNPTNYCTLHGLPAPNWQYRPMPGCYGTQRCHYCGERAHDVDVVPNLHLNRPTSAHGLREQLLIDCCEDCKQLLGPITTHVPKKRRHALLVALRIVHKRQRGPLTSPLRVRTARRLAFMVAHLS